MTFQMRPLHALFVAAALVAVPAATAALAALDSSSALHQASALAFHGGPTGQLEIAGAAAVFTFAPAQDLDPTRHAVIVRAPVTSFTSVQVADLIIFLERGGRMVVADDGGAGRSLLEALGAGLTLGPGRVYSPGFAGSPGNPVAVSTGAISGFPASLTLSRPGTVLGGTPVLLGPELAWVDLNANQRPDLDEPLTPFPVFAAVATFGAGAIAVVADGHGLDGPAGAPLLQWAAQGGRVLVFDEAHRRLVDPFGLVKSLAGGTTVVWAAGILLSAAAIGLLSVLGPRFSAESARPPAPLRGITPERLASLLDELDRQERAAGRRVREE